MKKKFTYLLFMIPVLLLLVACGSDEPSAADTEETEAEAYVDTDEDAGEDVEQEEEVGFVDIDLRPVDPDNPQVAIEIEGHGVITIELFPEYAPVTVENFIQLVEDGFYNGITFHRIISGFMMQGGCPYGMGIGGSDETIFGEFLVNGFDNPIRHRPGVLSMARAGDMNGASSQFFIMDGYAPHLDGVHAAFGRVVTGMDVVDAVIASVTPTDGNGSIAPEDQPIISYARVIEGS